MNQPLPANKNGTVRFAYPAPGRIAISGLNFSGAEIPAVRRFIAAVFSVAAVRRLSINRAGTRAVLEHEPPSAPESVLKKIAEAFKTAGSPVTTAGCDGLFLRRAGDETIRITRYPGGLTTWEATHLLPGRVRLRHPALYRRPLAARLVSDDLSLLAGILGVDGHPATGGLLIRYDSGRVTLQEILSRLEQGLADIPPEAFALAPPDTGLLLKGASLVAASLSESLYPALKPLSAGLLITANADTLEKALRRLFAGRIGPETVEAALLLLALRTNSYLSGSLMTLLVELWPRLWAGTLGHQERTGHAAPDRRPEHTAVSMQKREPGKRGPSALMQKATLPLLALGGAALLAHGPLAAQAVLRPEYETGLTMARRMSALRAVANLGRRGISVREGAALERIAEADVLIVDADRVKKRGPLEEALRLWPAAQIVLVTGAGATAAVKSAARLGADLYVPGAGEAARAAVIRYFREQGQTVCYLGSGPDAAKACGEADAAVLFRDTEPGTPGGMAADIACPHGAAIRDLLAELGAHRSRVITGNRLAILPNLTGVAGALFLGFPPLVSVLLSNLGILAVYMTSRRGLRSAEPAS